jgi:nitroreductase
LPDLEHIKHAPTETGIHDLIAARWSPRAFSDKKISSEDLTKIFTAASWAASSSNEQPWRFILGHKGDHTYARIFETLVDFNKMWAGSAPILVLTVAKKTFTGKEGNEPNHWAQHDLGAASANLCLQAIALGIHTHGMAGFDREKARALFTLPEDYTVVAVWAIGYLGDPNTLSERMQAPEKAPRTRKPLSEIVFNNWDQPAEL